MVTDTLTDTPDRQGELVSSRLQQMEIVVAGAGMVGGWLVPILTRTGALVIVYDFDKVGLENLQCQPYRREDIGLSKVSAVARLCTSAEVVIRVEERFPPEDDIRTPDVVISCVDSMIGREEIAKWCKGRNVGLFLDARVLGEIAAILSVTEKKGYTEYLRELPKDEDVPDAPCGARGTAYSGVAVASKMVGYVNNWAREIRVPKKIVWHTGLGDVMEEVR